MKDRQPYRLDSDGTVNPGNLEYNYRILLWIAGAFTRYTV